ncbi:hypothetical protein [Rhodophyticola porphyridii]|uniref:hypothetical protein n=1 Tax=Rhodophyticola porphyridii TaxID=1852017 RepID=UPI0011C41DCE|nr:hypothetical protein [Rhodophyticola porphyridii]
MAKPLKYLPGKRIKTIGEFADEIGTGRYLIDWHGGVPPEGRQGRRINPGWAASWQFNMICSLIERGCLFCTIPNPKHPHNKEPIV